MKQTLTYEKSFMCDMCKCMCMAMMSMCCLCMQNALCVMSLCLEGSV